MSHSRREQARAFALSLLVHVSLGGALWVSTRVAMRGGDQRAAPAVMRVGLESSSADIERVEALIELSRPTTPVHAPPASASITTQHVASEQPSDQGLLPPVGVESTPENVTPAAPTIDADKPQPPLTSEGSSAGEAGSANDPLLEAGYLAAISAATQGRWSRAGAPTGIACELEYSQSPGGVVTEVRFTDCPWDDVARRSVEDAMRAAPLPYLGFEGVFARHQTGALSFCQPVEACDH